MAPKSILLIEHEPSIREVLSACLRELGGWRVTASTSIQEGIGLCGLVHPDAILVDASAPEADALVFIEQLKQYSVSLAVPLVLITNRANWFTLPELHQMGFAGTIPKPFNPITLSAYVSQLLHWNSLDSANGLR